MIQPLHIANAHIYNASVENRYEQRDLYTTDMVVAERPKNALTVDLSGYTVFPGLVNAHDHLELNHYPRTKFRDRYDNAHQWGEDVNAHLDESPFKELRAYPLEDRCFIGGLKNLLCGATTVIHHNPPHKCLFKNDFPVRVLKRYGWTHSLHFSSDEEIVASYKSTPPDAPWLIHLAEGTDEIAAGEYQRLKALGCVQSNTVFVHGVGLTDEDIADAAPRVRGLVWCPTTNNYLLGKTTRARKWMESGGRIALGSDSRLTSEDDLSLEMATVYHCDDPYERNFWQKSQINAVTDWSAQILDLTDRGHLRVGAKADFVAVLSDTAFYRNLSDLVVREGVPQIGDPDVMAKFPHVETIPVRLDDKEKSMNLQLARQIARCTLKEPGLELLEDPLARRRWRVF
jgi:hypothetical protein